jgi:hypothetical protein
LSLQNANNVSIIGGTVTGIVDLAIADGGTGASNPSGARSKYFFHLIAVMVVKYCLLILAQQM